MTELQKYTKKLTTIRGVIENSEEVGNHYYEFEESNTQMGKLLFKRVCEYNEQFTTFIHNLHSQR